MADRREAEKALYSAIKSCAENAGEEKDGDALKAAAESFQRVAHGPQGGKFGVDRHTKEESTSVSTSESKHSGETHYDYHETHHKDGSKRRAGFD